MAGAVRITIAWVLSAPLSASRRMAVGDLISLGKWALELVPVIEPLSRSIQSTK